MALDGWLLLALAVVRVAAQDAQRGNYSAAAWLRHSDLARLTYAVCDVDESVIDRWLLKL